jgi:anti-anti-sigma regulatory factor
VSEEIMGKALIVVDRSSGCGHSCPLRLSVVDDLDLSTEQQARIDLRAALDAAEHTEFLLDASQAFVDVRGLAVLLDATWHARSNGRTLAVNPSPTLRRMCQVLELDELALLDDPVLAVQAGRRAEVRHAS